MCTRGERQTQIMSSTIAMPSNDLQSWAATENDAKVNESDNMMVFRLELWIRLYFSRDGAFYTCSDRLLNPVGPATEREQSPNLVEGLNTDSSRSLNHLSPVLCYAIPCYA